MRNAKLWINRTSNQNIEGFTIINDKDFVAFKGLRTCLNFRKTLLMFLDTKTLSTNVVGLMFSLICFAAS